MQKTRYIILHVPANRYINLHYEYVTSIDKAARFGSVEDAETYFKESYYKTDKPDEYEVVPIRITYELESEVSPHVPQEREHQKHSGRASSV